ncbi:MAG: HAMP domain-containing histidine kinase [Rhizobiaceae bacterium]|nr:HAMP domain-containing histidine kinase [Rhizobiaceae bacterium]MCV0405702.1 HAMP domain-containing histidine kinase [Rhizobiaceae bacterium]
MAEGQVTGQVDCAADVAVPVRRRLSTKLLLLTVLFVMIAEVLIFPPSVANYRLTWLEQRLESAAAVSIVLLETDPEAIAEDTQDDLLSTTGVMAIAVRDDGVSRLMFGDAMPDVVDEHVDLANTGPLEAIERAAATLFTGGDKVLRVFGPVGDGTTEFEIIIRDDRLRKAMLVYSRNIALLSLLISIITAALVFGAINQLMIRPIRKLRTSMLWFAEEPSDPARVIRPQPRDDELGVAQRELASMQSQLQRTLAEQKHLADLGLAVSKINHDLRNILASAQLISDRLGQVRDPSVQAFAPKLVRTLDRAVGYTESVLAYGRAQEPPPSRRRIRLRQLIDDVHGLLGVDPEAGIELVNAVDHALEVDADSEQLFRVLSNLCRNAVQAMSAERDATVVRRLSIEAAREGSVSHIDVIDTGPGLPQKARENLFSAFRGAARSGGTGLGLAIAFELVRAHGGSIDLVESQGGRTVFRVSIPDQPVVLEEARSALRQPA